MAQTYAQNLATAQTLQTCGAGFVAIVGDPDVDEILVKDGTVDDNCGTNLAWKPFPGSHAEVEVSGEPDSITG